MRCPSIGLFFDQLYLLVDFIKITLLIFPILDFEGFIKGHEILFGKSSLWSFVVIYGSVSCSFSILSDMDSLSGILLAWLFTLFTFCWSDFLYVLWYFLLAAFYIHINQICVHVEIYQQKRILCHCSLFASCHCWVFHENCLFFWIQWISKRSFSKFDSCSTAGGHLIYWKP